MKYTREQIEAYRKEFKEYAKNKYPYKRLNFSIGEEFLEHKFPKKLPEEGLLVSKHGSLVYRTGKRTGYGFDSNKDYGILINDSYDELGWTFNNSPQEWQIATPEQEEKFIKMLEIECEKHLLFENTKIDKHADGTSLVYPNCTGITPRFNSTHGYNRNGLIFHRGKFATPRKEETILTQISKVIKEREDFSVERTESGLIILTPKNK